VRPGQWCVQGVLEPLPGCRLLTLGTGTIAPGMLDAVLSPTAGALREAVAVVSTLALVAGADDLAVGAGEVGRALQVLWRKGGAELAEGGPGWRPCMRALRRS
jgi:hypothetical protein